MKSLVDITIAPSCSIRSALLKIDASGTQIIMVVDAANKLLGTLSDGDVRRGLLKGLSLSSTVDKCMFCTPFTAKSSDDPSSTLDLMRRKKLHQVPIINEDGIVVRLETLDDFVFPKVRENLVVIMAGGLGTRLGKLTKNIPKPMLDVGGRPLLETILLNFIDQGFHNFYFSVNYKADIIEQYFGDGAKFGVDIRYLKEDKRLGTVGSLSLLPVMPAEPLIVSNGDVLAKIDYMHMVDAHSHADLNVGATVGVNEYEFQIPYGVIHAENGIMQRIEEKPVHASLISGGVNVLSPQAIKLIPKDIYFDMPSLFEKLIEKNIKVKTYKLQEYWLDVGYAPDYQKAKEDITSVFPLKNYR